MTVKIRKDISPEAVYARAKQEKSAEIRARLLGIAAALEGKKRSDSAKLAGLTIDNIRTWITRFNEHGFDGLVNKKQPGSQSTWTSEIEQYLKDKATKGACFEDDGRVAYRLKD